MNSKKGKQEREKKEKLVENSFFLAYFSSLPFALVRLGEL
jgi:hypothetical protein